MKITNGKIIKNVSLGTWEQIKHKDTWRPLDEKTNRAKPPVEVTEHMKSKVSMPSTKDDYRKLLDNMGVEYDKRLGLTKLKELYEDQK